MKEFTVMEQAEFESRIAPYVNKIVDEESKLVTYEYKRRPRRDQISLTGQPFAQVSLGAPARRVSTPDGIFINAGAAADHYGLTKEEMYARITKSRRLKDGIWVLLEP